MDKTLNIRSADNGYIANISHWEGEPNMRNYKDTSYIFSTWEEVVKFITDNPIKE